MLLVEFGAYTTIPSIEHVRVTRLHIFH
uniref:Uncharacterized protein n=1 Tax=Arundo donax TaxID=35708 RepID=A0A0A9A0B8_ARUDO